MNYNEYLFSCLLKIYDKTFAELEYDLQFEQVPVLYAEFCNFIRPVKLYSDNEIIKILKEHDV
jgi:hypothetical protein